MGIPCTKPKTLCTGQNDNFERMQKRVTFQKIIDNLTIVAVKGLQRHFVCGTVSHSVHFSENLHCSLTAELRAWPGCRVEASKICHNFVRRGMHEYISAQSVLKMNGMPLPPQYGLKSGSTSVESWCTIRFLPDVLRCRWDLNCTCALNSPCNNNSFGAGLEVPQFTECHSLDAVLKERGI